MKVLKIYPQSNSNNIRIDIKFFENMKQMFGP